MTHVMFDEIENMLATMDMLAIIAPRVKLRRQQTLWKWIVVGAHDALQGALVCAVNDTTGTRVLSKRSAKEMLNWLEDTSQKFPGEFMAHFDMLLKRSKIKLAAQDRRDVKKLHEFRNDFVHFTPKTWAIEMAGLPRIVGCALRVAAELMQQGQVQIKMTGNKKRRLRERVEAINIALRT